MNDEAILLYLPPDGNAYATAMLKNLERFKTRRRMIFFSDYPWGYLVKGLIRVGSMDAFKSGKNPHAVHNAVFLQALVLARLHQVKRMLYLETDCRIAGDYWDDAIFNEVGDGDWIVAGNIAFQNLDLATPNFREAANAVVQQEHDRTGFRPATYKEKNVNKKFLYCPSAFINGALAIYKVDEVVKFFPKGNIGVIAQNICAFDLHIGRTLYAKHGVNSIQLLKNIGCVLSRFQDAPYPEHALMELLKYRRFVGVHPIKSHWIPQHDDLAPLYGSIIGGNFSFDKKPYSIVQLGRYGDIINILPVVKKIFLDSGHEVEMIVHKDFAGILDGVSYVTPVIFQGAINDPIGASKLCTPGKEILITQMDGNPNRNGTHGCFAVESWSKAGCSHLWGTIRVDFDMRSPERETALVDATIKSGKKTILVSSRGHSGFFKHWQHLENTMASTFKDYNVVQLGSIKASRIYDMLGLYDKAACLVTIDTAHIHLASASKVPVIYLLNDDPPGWQGFKCPTARVYFQSSYSKYFDDLEDLIAAVRYVTDPPKIVHVYSDYEPNKEDARRIAEAMKSWVIAKNEDLNWQTLPIKNRDLPREFDDRIRKLPFVKDILDKALEYSGPDGIIILTNIDIAIQPDAGFLIRKYLFSHNACSATRREVENFKVNLPEQIIRERLHCGSDLFAMRGQWWMDVRDNYGDFLLAAESWDLHFNKLIERFGDGANFNFDNIITHVYHPAFWCRAENMNTTPSQLHNRQVKSKLNEPTKNAWVRNHPLAYEHRC